MRKKRIQSPLNNVRYVARHAVLDGIEFQMSFVEIIDDIVHVSPFEVETHSTVYVDSITIFTENGKLKYLEIN